MGRSTTTKTGRDKTPYKEIDETYIAVQKYPNTCRHPLEIYRVSYTRYSEILLTLLRDTTGAIVSVKFQTHLDVYTLIYHKYDFM